MIPKYLPSSPITLFGVAACFLLSGFAALLYQMAWMRQFSTVFGTSEIAVATVLSAYMGGLALGAAVSARLINLIPKPILFYGVLEALIAISALAVPWLLVIASWLYSAVLGGQMVIPNAEGLGQPLFYFFVAFTVLILPTACMGATLPVLTRYAVTQDSEISSRVGGLYAVNTLGAVCGALFAGFILLPRLGLQGTVWFGVLVNVVVFALAVFVSRMSAEQPFISPELGVDQGLSLGSQNTEPKSAGASKFSRKFTWLILPVMTLSGICTFVYEVLWTRLVSHILGGSLSAFAIMLGSFLSGIAIGSFVASRFATTRLRAASFFVFCQIAIALSSIFIYYFLNNFLQSELDQRGNGVLAFLVLMPATLFIGATFPLAVRIYASGANTAASASARVYAWNTFGAILGAALAGFFLVPLLKYEGAIRAAVILNALLALVVASVIGRSRGFHWTQIGLSLGICLTLVIGYYPQPPENVLRYSSISNRAQGEILFYDVGRSSTVLLYEEQGAYMLRNNGLPEAGAMPAGTPNRLINQRLLGALPLLARPDIQNALIVGLGAGTAVTGVPPRVQEIDVIELEPKVIEANRLISDKRKYQPLQDPRVSLYINDARSALALSDKEYDMIVSQPSHPWTAGASHLFTREYMQMVSDNLSDDGVFLQWINSQFVDEQLLRDLCATIADVYPYVRMYQWSPQVLFFLASDQPMPIEQQILNTARPFSDAPSFYLELGVATLEDSIAALMMDESALAEFASSGRPITDNFNMMAMESARLAREGRELSIGKLAEVLRPWIPALDPDSWVHRDYSDQLNFSRFVERYALLNTRAYSNELVGALSEAGNPQSMLVAGELLRLEGDQEAANNMFVAALAAIPESNYAKYALVQPWLRLLGSSEISQESAGDQNTNTPGNSEISEIEAVVPEEIIAITESMSGSAKTVMEGVIALNQRDFQQLSDLDVRLSETKPADPWFVESVKLRVDWRNLISDGEQKTAFAEQTRQILDLALATNNDHEFLAMRIAAAASAGREHEIIEIARGYIKLLDFQLAALEQNYLAPAAAELDMKLGQINAISPLVAQVSDRPGIAEAKQEVQSGLANLVKRMQGVLRG